MGAFCNCIVMSVPSLRDASLCCCRCSQLWEESLLGFTPLACPPFVPQARRLIRPLKLSPAPALRRGDEVQIGKFRMLFFTHPG